MLPGRKGELGEGGRSLFDCVLCLRVIRCLSWMAEVLATRLPRWALPSCSSHTSGCQVPHTVLLQGHRGSGGEAEGWEGTLLALGRFLIFSIYHFTKKKKKKCEFDPQVIPLSTCLFVTAGGFTLPITAWCHSLSRVRIKLSWTWGFLFLQSCVSSCSLDLSHLCITWFSDGWFCIFADLSCTCIVPVRFPSLWKASD